MVEINGKTIPDAGQTVEHIVDEIGGWLYVVTTAVTVGQQRLDQVQERLAEATAERDKAQALVDKLQETVDTLSAT